MYIEIVKVEPVQSAPGKSGTYQTVDVAYKNQDGKIQGKKLVSFNNKDVFDSIARAASGDKFEVTVKQDGKFWNWVGITPASGAPAQRSFPAAAEGTSGSRPAGKVIGSNYETPAERERRQLYIGRQAVLNTAINYFELTKQKASLDEVIDVAGKLEMWVRRPSDAVRLLAEDAIRDMPDDIPTS